LKSYEIRTCYGLMKISGKTQVWIPSNFIIF